jgi:hypothetical protein
MAAWPSGDRGEFMQWRSLPAALAALALCAGEARAQDGLPDPEAVALPPMTFGDDPGVAENGYKFFFFHNPDIGFAEAYADVAECRSHLPTGAYLPLPGFVPWVESNQREVEPGVNPYGVVGVVVYAAIASVIMPKMERGQRNNKMRLCMERRGYVRYAIDEAAYDALNSGEEADIVAMQAKLAVSPAPPAPQVIDE